MAAPSPLRPLALTSQQRDHYREHGWLAVPAFVDGVWLDRLRAVTDEFVEQSRSLTESNVIFDLDAGHSADGTAPASTQLAHRPTRDLLVVRVGLFDRRRRGRPRR